jgi:hypothetical protein
MNGIKNSIQPSNKNTHTYIYIYIYIIDPPTGREEGGCDINISTVFLTKYFSFALLFL